MKLTKRQKALVERLRAVLDARTKLYRELSAGRAARTVGDYLAGKGTREDEESLTEPILAELLERVLDFPKDAYFPQLSRSGLKPDFTPVDLVAHPFVLDAKSSTQKLAAHEPQIRRYMDQRRLDYGVVFNLRELRVYQRDRSGFEKALSFQLLPLWQIARGEAIPSVEIERFERFCDRFGHKSLEEAQKIVRIRRAPRWADLERSGEELAVDIEHLVDRLRDLSRMLADDASARHEDLDALLALNPARERGLLDELRLLALDIAPGTKPDDLPAGVEGFRAGDGVAGRAWRQYLLRVAQLALIRILLYRSWEDAGFVDERLYDGGFGDVYDRLGENVQDVLREAFSRGNERYRWLYGQDNNYDWYRPRDAALIEVLYSLVPVPLGKLDADVLGGLYESYVDEIDRDRLGQFYTPRSVVRFMLDRAGFAGTDGVFDLAGDDRGARKLLDFATGSGGFLVEAARRIVEEVDSEDARGINEGLAAIVRGLHGCEISPFPYYLTEVNLLLQVSRLLGRLRVHGADAPPFVLGVTPADTLATRRAPDEMIAALDPSAKLVDDPRVGLMNLDAEKRDAFVRMRENDSFDLVVGNPPYVAEAGNKILFDRLRELPAWKHVYRGKSDYLYYFLYLAAEKLAPGGRLAVITPAGWMNAGNAAWLRDKLAGSLRLDELFLFGSYRLFAPDALRRSNPHRAPTPTVESAILIATKAPAPAAHRLKVVALEDEPAAAAAMAGHEDSRSPERDELLGEMMRRAAGRAGRKNGIHVHRVLQRDLVADWPWPIKHGAQDAAARAVAHLQAALESDSAPVEPLTKHWDIFQGIQTGADSYGGRVQRRLSTEVKRRLAEDGARTGDPILELPPGTEHYPPWAGVPQLLARSPESRALLYGAIDDADYASLVWIGRDEDAPADVVGALEPWRPVLATRAELARNPKRRWFETAWARDKAQMRLPKVIALYRTDRGRFALDEAGEWQPSIKATICTAKHAGLSVAYLCGLLNSELLDLWYAVRGKTPWHVRRNYEPKPMAQIPYRHVDLAIALRDSKRVEKLQRRLDSGDALAAANLALEIGESLGDTGADLEAARALEALVRAIAGNRRALLPHRTVAPALTRIVKDPWRTGPFETDDAALVSSLPKAQLVSVRLDPELAAESATDGALGKATLAAGRLTFRRARHITATVTGPSERLALLERLVSRNAKLLSGELDRRLLPRDLTAYNDAVQERRRTITLLLQDGRLLVEATERLVCRLYSVPRELEDAIVAHAAARAERGTAAEGSE